MASNRSLFSFDMYGMPLRMTKTKPDVHLSQKSIHVDAVFKLSWRCNCVAEIQPFHRRSFQNKPVTVGALASAGYLV